jgi:uncharacterized protein YuzE
MINKFIISLFIINKHPEDLSNIHVGGNVVIFTNSVGKVVGVDVVGGNDGVGIIVGSDVVPFVQPVRQFFPQ